MTLPRLIAGRYELDELPVQGSMSEVWPGYDPRLDRRVAVKRIHPDLRGDPETLKRFEREARLTGRVRHPGVPSVLDYGTDDHGPYLVLEYVAGWTLRDLALEVGALPTEWVAAIGAQICAILDHTHAASLIHRDLKPANILLRPDGTVAVIDFGVAAVIGASRLSTVTALGVTAGTAEYQAPERRLGAESPLTDLYAVGRVLQDLSTGALRDVQAPGITARPDPRITAVIDDLTAPLPQDRPQSARTMVDRLLSMVDTLPSLPGFVPEAHGVAERVAALAAMRPPTPAPSAVAVSQADIPHLRRRAERHATEGRLGQAVALLDHLVAVTPPSDRQVIDLRWERARWLAEAGDSARLASELADLIGQMIQRFGPVHPAVTSARLTYGRALAAQGRVSESLVVLDELLRDMAEPHGPCDPRLHPARLEQGIQLAVAGELGKAKEVLQALADDQKAQLGPHHPDLAGTFDVLSALEEADTIPRAANDDHQGGSLKTDWVQVPDPRADDNELIAFAHSFNGYTALGGFDEVATLTAGVRASWQRNGSLPDDIKTLRVCLFFEVRAHRHSGGYEPFKADPFVLALLDQIRVVSGGRVQRL